MPTRKTKKIAKSNKSYKNTYLSSYGGKRPLWHWLLIYLAIGILVYGFIYYYILGSKGNNQYKSPAPTAKPLYNIK